MTPAAVRRATFRDGAHHEPADYANPSGFATFSKFLLFRRMRWYFDVPLPYRIRVGYHRP
jgi:hypothetical protein